MELKLKLLNKREFKLISKKCRFCPEKRYAALNVHRILPGEDGGRYTFDNAVCVCANCHNMIHDGYYEIDRYYVSTMGRVLRVLVGPNKEERFY